MNKQEKDYLWRRCHIMMDHAVRDFKNGLPEEPDDEQDIEKQLKASTLKAKVGGLALAEVLLRREWSLFDIFNPSKEAQHTLDYLADVTKRLEKWQRQSDNEKQSLKDEIYLGLIEPDAALARAEDIVHDFQLEFGESI